MQISGNDSIKLYMASTEASAAQIKSLNPAERKTLFIAMQNIREGNLSTQDSTRPEDIKSVLAKLQKGAPTIIKEETKSSSIFSKFLKGLSNIVGALTQGEYGRIGSGQLNSMSKNLNIETEIKLVKKEITHADEYGDFDKSDAATKKLENLKKYETMKNSMGSQNADAVIAFNAQQDREKAKKK